MMCRSILTTQGGALAGTTTAVRPMHISVFQLNLATLSIIGQCLDTSILFLRKVDLRTKARLSEPLSTFMWPTYAPCRPLLSYSWSEQSLREKQETEVDQLVSIRYSIAMSKIDTSRTRSSNQARPHVTFSLL